MNALTRTVLSLAPALLALTCGSSPRCDAGMTACDGQCVNLAEDFAHCGACGQVCPEARPHCRAGVCSVCPTHYPGNFLQCGEACVDTATEPLHCGGCDQPCMGSGLYCRAGACSACAAWATEGSADCGGTCTDTRSDPANCGACGHACAAAPHTAAHCSQSTCSVTCEPGFSDCDGEAGNGCEVALDDPAFCSKCGSSCDGGCGTSVFASMTTQPSDWKFNGAAHYDAAAHSGVLTLVSDGARAGSIVYQNPIQTDAFDLRFTFTIGGGNGADGMGFMMQTNGPNAVGQPGLGLGLYGLHGLGLELDTWKNDGTCDLDDNHVGLADLSGVSCPFALATPPFKLRNTGPHEVTVHFDRGAVQVSLDDAGLLDAGTLPGFRSGTPYYFGFGGSNGGFTDRHEVKNVELNFPTPRCL